MLRRPRVLLSLTLALLMGAALLASSAAGPASAAATRIRFKKGTFCGTYSGDFRKPRQFLLALAADQLFVVRNVGGGLQYNVTVTGPTGPLFGEKPSPSRLEYYTEARGDHFVTVSATQRYTAVQFCAY